MKRYIFLTISLLFIAFSAPAKLTVTHLTIEGRSDKPLGLDLEHPRLGWQITANDGEKEVVQKSYHIRVASHPDSLRAGKGDLWDVTVKSNRSQWIEYQGKNLKVNQRAYWQVRVECAVKGNKKGVLSEWSDVSMWGAGLLYEGNWKGRWIGLDYAMPWDVEDVHSQLSARYYRTTFAMKKKTMRHATLHISGLGLYEAFINGKRIGNKVLTPAPTDYRRSIIYDSYDVTPLMNSAQDYRNCLAVTVSNGRFYTMQQKKKLYKIPNFGYPTLRANLIIEYTDGSSEVVSTNEKTWKMTADGPVRSSNEYDGETYDARKEMADWQTVGYDDSAWMAPERSALPTGFVRGNTTPGMEVIDMLRPKGTITTKDGRLMIDFGQNMAGIVRVPIGRLGLHEGDTLRLRFAEKLQAPVGAPWTDEQSRLGNGPGYCLTDTSELYIENLRNALVTDYYIANGRESQDATWTPRFTYHGFRFMEAVLLHCESTGITTQNQSFYNGGDGWEALVVSDPMERLYTFNTDNQLLNRIIQNAYWGIRSNYKGMPVDCPQRDERQPWLGDHSMGCWGESYMLNNYTLYMKWMQDIEDSQRSDGSLPGVAPAFWNYYNDDVSWPSVFVFASEMLYRQYGDAEAFRRHYPAMRKWITHFWRDRRDEKTGLITADKYADWCCPPESPELIHSEDPNRVTDGTLIASCYMYKLLGVMIDMGAEDRELFEQMRKELRVAINKEFLHIPEKKQSVAPVHGEHILYPDSIFYSNNSVTANLLPYAFGIVPDEYAETVARWIMRKHLLLPNGTSELANVSGHIQCGVIGMSWLLRSLRDMGRMDIAYMLATTPSYPGWGYMARHGATTIWELWNGDTANPKMNSGNHIMLLGDLIPWCMEDIGGIKALEPGFSKILMAPDFSLAELPRASASYLSPYGKISSQWEKRNGRLTWHISIPANASAEVILPDGKHKTYGSGDYIIETQLSKIKGVTVDELVYDLPFNTPLEWGEAGATPPSCHAATIAELSDGDLLAAFFAGTREGHPDVCIYTSRKRKDAEAWEPIQLVVKGEGKAGYNPVLYQIPGGDLLLFYKIGKNVKDWTGYLMRSSDNGVTWGKPQVLGTPEEKGEGLLGAIKNKPVMLPAGFRCKDGTILTQRRLVSPSSKEEGGWRCYTEVSEDEGYTWKLCGPVEAPNGIRAIQPTILVHKDGRLQMLCRTGKPKAEKGEGEEMARIATAWSEDGGLSWSALSLLDNMPNNNSGIDAVTLSDGRFALVYNRFSYVEGPDKPLRNPLVLAYSKDGIHWEDAITLESSPISQYSYPSIIQGNDGALHIIYTWRRQGIKYQRVK